MVGIDVVERDRQCAARGNHARRQRLQQGVSRDRAADFVAVNQRAHAHMRARVRTRERPGVRQPGVASGPATNVGKRRFDARAPVRPR